MQSVDLDSVTSRDIREALAERVGCVDGHKVFLKAFCGVNVKNSVLPQLQDFIDREMLVILGQMDKPSRIFPYLLLGTEWNASNWEELNKNKCVNSNNLKSTVYIIFFSLHLQSNFVVSVSVIY